MSRKNKIFLFLSFTTMLASCKNYLDIAPKEFYTENDLFADVAQAEKEVAVLYGDLNGDFDGTADGSILSLVCDEGYPTSLQAKASKYISGGWTSTNDDMRNFDQMYREIRIGYHFLENIDKVPIKNDNQTTQYKTVIIPRYKGEVKFLIAYYYFLLFEKYGGVPIVDHYYTVNQNDEALKLPRATVDKTVSFITKLCDEAAAALPQDYADQDIGRVTKGAALALKAKVLLYAASPLFNGGEIDNQAVTVDGTSVKNTILGVKNLDGTLIFNTTYNKEKWKLAIDAIKAVMDLGIYDLRADRAELFYKRDYKEVIWFRQGGPSNNWEANTMPNGTDYGGTGAISTPQEMVDAYEMKNGLAITTPGSGYSETGYVDTLMRVFRNRQWQTVKTTISKMYFNRDPRFYTDQYFNQMPLLGRNVITEFTKALGTNQDGWGKTGQSTRTGYYVQKWNDPTQNLKDRPNTNYRNYPFIRYADVLLWYAEALNEYYGPVTDAYTALNRVRSRVGMPGLPLTTADNTQQGLRKRIQNERRIELAYEGARYYDIRRWLIATAPEQMKMTGMNIMEGGDKFYARIPLLSGTRIFPVNYYLSPIPSSETAIMPTLTQNYGWGR
ncbi:putative outer membrane starch-binding protein [Chitinophaga dinghuensis]|uniref:Putative outer membrane starch-binding protein n=2 Tax=Chitinophaga dinghuensis TaxID=1539050 RepID=A0A327WET5_9BACT|nr:putative outer membrane starch-binding protein [Chitinophaga dinghuensis]